MEKITCLDEIRKKKYPITTALAKIPKSNDKAWFLYTNLITVIKQKFIPSQKLAKLISFLIIFFKIKPEEIPNYILEEKEFEDYKFQIKKENISIDYLIIQTIDSFRKKELSRNVALRIIKISKVWYKIPNLFLIK